MGYFFLHAEKWSEHNDTKFGWYIYGCPCKHRPLYGVAWAARGFVAVSRQRPRARPIEILSCHSDCESNHVNEKHQNTNLSVSRTLLYMIHEDPIVGRPLRL